MDPSPRTLLLARELDAVADAVDRIEAAEERLTTVGLDSKNPQRTLDTNLRAHQRALCAYRAARKALDERCRELGLNRKEGLIVDPGALYDSEDDDDETPGEATIRARRKVRSQRLNAPSGDPGLWNRTSPVQTRWGNKTASAFEMKPLERLA